VTRAVLILIDGLPADHFAAHRGTLRALDSLARRGALVERFVPPVPSTSMPGRATLLTGTEPLAHGVYGNAVLNDDAFRDAQPGDIAVPTLAGLATLAGRRVVSLGFGMVDPADTAAAIAPWWKHKPLPGESNAKDPAGGRLRHDPHLLLAGIAEPGAFSFGQGHGDHGTVHPQMHGIASDAWMMQAAGDLLCGDTPPDLLLAEISSPDAVLHYHGLGSGAVGFIALAADLLLGRLVERLAAAGRLDDTLIAAFSDHGHSPVSRAIYPAALLPDAVWASEGGTLHVRAEGAPLGVPDRLAGAGLRLATEADMPAAARGRILRFLAPEGAAFERIPGDGTEGAPRVVATHGHRPGTPGDDGVCVLAGPGVRAASVVPRAAMAALAPTIAAILGLPHPGMAAPLPVTEAS
jgi:predicted AlkP superfamily pyrophosphatase or phosphodiesterase